MDFFQTDEQNLTRKVAGWVVDIAVTLAFAWFCLNFFGTQVTMNGQSMQPLLNSDDVVLVNRMAYEFGKPSRLDVVVFDREGSKNNIKRVIGVPGDKIQISDGQIYINDQPFLVEGLEHASLAGLAEKPIVLEEDEYFLLGDNRDSSEDSRFANVGNVKESQITGKVWLRLLPFINIRFIRSH